MMRQLQTQRNNLALGAFLLFFLASASVAYASQTSGTIDSTYKYAWGTVAGWINFSPTNGGLTITDSLITGYAWGANTGWINFAAAQSHVTNDSSGTLGGFAWDQGGGWVSFVGVTIDTSGKFHGMATGGTISGASYVINFDCTSCDVRTDWRPASSRTTTSSSGSSSGGGSISPVYIPTPQNASSTVTTITTVTKVSTSPQPTSNTSGKNNPNTKNLISTTTTFKNTIPASSTTHASTTAKKTTTFSFFNFVNSILRNIYSGILGFFRFFFKF